MEKLDLKKSIDNEIEALNLRRNLFYIKSKRINDYNNIDKLDEIIVSNKRAYSFLIFIGLVCGGSLYFGAFAQIFEYNFLNWSKSGLLIIMTLGTLGNAWNHKINYERLRMIKYLLELKNEIGH